jgi:hypothetical protein
MRTFFINLFCFACFSLHAQIGKVGINTTTPAAMLHVMDSSVLFTGPAGLPPSPGNPPVSGPGTRFMWYPNKAALRIGTALGQQWSKDSIGSYSFAQGYDVRAFGYNSIAMGNLTKANGPHSVALGATNITSGQQSSALGSFLTTSGFWSTALGVGNTASGEASTAIGNNSKASGNKAVAIGSQLISKSVNCFVAGQLNDTTSISSVTWIGTDPLFIIGNGIFGSRSNAMTVLKNGNTGIGTISPQKLLHISAGVSGVTPTASSVALFEDNTDVSINLMTPDADESAVYFGNPTNAMHGGIVYNSTVPNGLAFRTNGSISKVAINDLGNLGVGTNAPQRLIHISAGVSGAIPAATSIGVIEDDANVSLNLLTPNGNESAVFFGNPTNPMHGGIVYNSTVPNGLAFRTNGIFSKVAINDAGNLGVGTNSPQRLLHISGGVSGATPHSSSIAVIEDDANVSINLLAPNADESSIFFGNPSSNVHGGISYNSTVANGLAFRTNGNSTRMVINDTGNVGIGDNSPNARLHVSKGVSGSTYFSTAGIVMEDDAVSFLQFSTPSTTENGILSSTEAASVRSGVIFRPDSSLQLRAGGNTTRLSVDKSGNTNITGEINRTATGGANVVPVCYGSVDAAGAILTGSGNFTVAATPPGLYEITITGETYTNSGYASSATAVSSNPRFISIGSSGGKLVVRIFNSAAALTDTAFHFIVFEP